VVHSHENRPQKYLSNGLGFKSVSPAVEIKSKRCYYKGSHLARSRSNITKKGKIMKKKSLAFVLAGIMLCLVAAPAFAKRHHKKHHHHHHSTQQAQR
jgi:hypothetical protein